MFVYEKKVDDERHIFGARGPVVSDADVPVTYTDGDENILEDVVYDDIYLDATRHQMRRVSDDSLVEMWISDDQPEDINVIPGWKVGPIGKRLRIKCEPVTDPSIDLLGKNCDDLQENIVIKNDSVTGRLKYVLDYTGFSSKPEEQEGNFIAVKFTANEGAEITVNGVKLDDDGIFIAIVPQDAEEPKLIAVAKLEGFDDKELTINLKDVDRDPIPPFFYWGAGGGPADGEVVESIEGLNREVMDIETVLTDGIVMSIPSGRVNPEHPDDPTEDLGQHPTIAVDKSLKLDQWYSVSAKQDVTEMAVFKELDKCNLYSFYTAICDWRDEQPEILKFTFIPAN